MPDITMCQHPTCRMRRQCYRHADSGTQPTPKRQVYVEYEPGVFGCRGFVSTGRLERLAAEAPERHRALAQRWLEDPAIRAGLPGERITDQWGALLPKHEEREHG